MYQARSVLTQVVYSLAVAEESLQFEHRDLHWGNVLVKPTDQEDITYKLMGKRCSVPSMGVEANIIDFTLSRLTEGIKIIFTVSNHYLLCGFGIISGCQSSNIQSKWLLLGRMILFSYS